MGYLKNKVHNYKRKKSIKILTYNLGRIEETEDTVYCYVDEKKLKKKYKNKDIYGINLSYKTQAIQNITYVVNKNIVYVFNGITFDKRLAFCIFSNKHNYVTFENCTFTKSVYIIEAENVTFINNRSSEHRINFFTSRLKANKVGNLKFINDKTLSGFANSTFIDINCETLEMKDTTFRSDGPSVKVKNLIMNNSHIYSGEKIKIDVDTIELMNSDIYSSIAIDLNVKNCNYFSNIKAYNITYNGLSLTEHNNSFEYIDNLKEQRKQLVDTLATIKSIEEEYQKNEVSKYRKELKSSPLSRRLKRK